MKIYILLDTYLDLEQHCDFVDVFDDADELLKYIEKNQSDGHKFEIHTKEVKEQPSVYALLSFLLSMKMKVCIKRKDTVGKEPIKRKSLTQKNTKSFHGNLMVKHLITTITNDKD